MKCSSEDVGEEEPADIFEAEQTAAAKRKYRAAFVHEGLPDTFHAYVTAKEQLQSLMKIAAAFPYGEILKNGKLISC